jgi:hypothetical protein
MTPPHSDLSEEECHPVCRYMMYLDVYFLEVILEQFDLQVDMFGS